MKARSLHPAPLTVWQLTQKCKTFLPLPRGTQAQVRDAVRRGLNSRSTQSLPGPSRSSGVAGRPGQEAESHVAAVHVR